jgi:hypothetical protein
MEQEGEEFQRQRHLRARNRSQGFFLGMESRSVEE